MRSHVDVISRQNMSGKSSDGGQSLEQSLVKVEATVMLYDTVSRQWVCSNACTSPSKVNIYQHVTNNSFRVVGRSLEDRLVTINCLITGNLRYNQATPVFHQWRDSRQIYGLQFSNKEDADSFASAMIASLELLDLGADQQLYHLQHQQQDHQHQQQSLYSNPQQQQQQTMAQRSTPAPSNVNIIPQTKIYDSSRGYRHDQQYGDREQPGAEEVGQPDMTHNHSEAHPFRQHQQQEVQSSPLPSSQTIPFTSAARVQPPSLTKQLFPTRPASTSAENNSVTSNSSPGLSAPSDAATPGGPASAPPPPPPPPPSAAPIASQPSAKPSGFDLASALQGVKLRETSKSAETESKEAKTSGLQSMTLGRATKVVPVFPPSSGTATVGRASGGPPPATRPKVSVMSEMEKKLKERKEKSEGGTTATEQQMPRRGAAGLQDLFQGNQPQQRTGNTMAAGSEEEIPLSSLSSAENGVAVQRAQEVKAARGGAAMSAVSSNGNDSRLILPAEWEAVKVELVTKIKQELENTKQEIINAIRSELTKQLS